MNADLRNALIRCETDIEETLLRLSGDEDLYLNCLEMFVRDTTMAELESALKTQSWDDAFTAAHALKGLAGNMGFIPLFHATAKLVVLIRAGRIKEVNASYAELKHCYGEILKAICKYCNMNSGEFKEEKA